MKIRNRISIFYTVVTALILGAIMLTVLLVSNRYIDSLFDSYLAEKALLCAQKNWEKDELSEKSYGQVLDNYRALLPTAEEVAIDSLSPDMDLQLGAYLSSDQISRLLSHEVVYFTHGQKRGLALCYPDNEGSFFVLVMAENGYGNSIKRYSLILLSLLFALSCIIIFVASRIHSKHTLRPLQHMLDQVSDVDADKLEQRVVEYGNDDELDRLAQQINNMLDRLHQAFVREKQFVRNASHQLNNPLTIIRGECELALMRRRTPEEYEKSMTKILATEEQIGQTIKQLLMLADSQERIHPSTLEVVDLKHYVGEMCEDWERVRFEEDVQQDECLVTTEPNLLYTALENIISNACKYSQQEVNVRLSMSEGAPLISVSDKGIGIPQADIDHVFEPFYRASNTHLFPGQGIGLSLTKRTCQLINIDLSVESKEGEWTQFELLFRDLQSEG